MDDKNYLLIIDEDPVEKELSDYFNHFDIKITHREQLSTIFEESALPLAVLINCKLLKNQYEIIQKIYETLAVPLIVINNADETSHSVEALEAGADDFLSKPLLPRELHARISAINRRVIRNKPLNASDKDVLVFANCRLYPSSRQVFNKHNEELCLSAGEYDLLYAFVQQPQQVLDREFLSQITRQNELNPLDRRIDVQISRLRQKIEPGEKKPALIKTIRNSGYLFTARVLSLKESELN